MTSMGAQRSTAQMIPTPGFVNSVTNNNSGGFSAEPTIVPQSQQQQQRQHTGGQNSHMLSNHMAAGVRPDMQSKPSGAANSSVNGDVGANEKIVDSGSSYTNASKKLQQGNFSLLSFRPDDLISGQHIESTFHISGEGYSTTNPDPFDGAITSAGTGTKAHNINTASFQPVSRVNSSLVSNQSILLCMQQCRPIKHLSL